MDSMDSMVLSKKALKEIKEQVRIEFNDLEEAIIQYMDTMITDSDISEKEAKNLTARDIKFMIKRYEY
jgi:hypothetical protein